MKTLVVYYSRTGNTKKIAEEIAQKLGADTEELIDQKNLTEIDTLIKNPDDYDVVIIGTPIWAGGITPAIRTYLSIHKIKKSAFFITADTPDQRKAFGQMLELNLATKLLSKATFATKDFKTGYEEKLNNFVEDIKVGFK